MVLFARSSSWKAALVVSCMVIAFLGFQSFQQHAQRIETTKQDWSKGKTAGSNPRPEIDIASKLHVKPNERNSSPAKRATSDHAQQVETNIARLLPSATKENPAPTTTPVHRSTPGQPSTAPKISTAAQRRPNARQDRTKSSAGQSKHFNVSVVPKYFEPSYFELYTRLPYTMRWDETRTVILPSMQLFWPQAHLVVVFDKESPADVEAAGTLAQKVAEEFPPLKVRGAVVADHASLLQAPGYGGWQRGQLDMMFADQIVKAKYVGLCDSDTFFITLVTPRSVFTEDGRPIIVGGYGRQEPVWSQAIVNTKFILKKDYVMSCMSYFPVTLATAHIAEMRAYVEKVHGKPFLDVYRDMLHQFYCHYSIMCNYVWYFHRDEYEWHFHNYFKDREGWDRQLEGQTTDWSFLTPQNKYPIARVSCHFAHTNLFAKFDPPYGFQMEPQGITGHISSYNPDLTGPWLVNSFCYSATAQCKSRKGNSDCKKALAACKTTDFDNNKLQMLMFRFEILQSWEWETRCIDAQRAHYRSLEKHPFWVPYALKILKSSTQKSHIFADLKL